MHSFLCGLDAEKQMKVLDGTTSQTLDGVGVAESLSRDDFGELPQAWGSSLLREAELHFPVRLPF